MKFKREDVKAITIKDPRYPNLLREIPDPPQKLYYLGDLPDNEKLKIAVVGTRKATTEGRLIAKKISRELAELGIIIVSGMAMGIDTAAHEGAVSASAKTAAVLGNGLPDIYPRQNQNLARKITDFKGAIISEYPDGVPALPNQFLERNRLISGFCIATIVIEAPERSGSLVTARNAAEQGREVFVIPGPVNHPNYRGSHALIRDGARLVTSTEDILADLNIKELKSPRETNQIINLEKIKDEKQLVILKTIQKAGAALSIDKIIELTKLEPQTANSSITILIINGWVRESDGKYAINI